MVALPTEEDGKDTTPAGETKTPRAEAAIKGMTPSQPAPIVADKPAPEVAAPETAASRFLKRIVSWFRHKEAPKPAAESPSAPRARPPARDAMRDPRRGSVRGPRRDETRELPETRGNRAQNEAPQSAAPARGEAQKPREPREPRETGAAREPSVAREPRRPRAEPRTERKPQTPAPVVADSTILPPVAAPAAVPASPSEQASEESGNTPRRRGRRGGRRERGERTETPLAAQSGAMAAVTDLSSSGQVESGAVTPVAASPEEDNASPDAASAAASPVLATSDEAQGTVAGIAPVVLTEPLTVVELPGAPDTEAPVALSAATETPVAPDAQPVVEAPAAEIPASGEAAAVVDQLPPLEPAQTFNPVAVSTSSISRQQTFEESGLIMVETSRDKVQPLPQESGDSQTAPAPRRRRVAVAIPDEPLVMVETRK
jgi:ribonuclease E